MGFLLRALAILAAIAGLMGGGYVAGHSAATAEAQSKAIKAEREARQRFDAEVRRGDRAVAELAAEQLQQADRYSQLQGAYRDLQRRVPLVAAQPGHVLGGCRSDAQPGVSHGAAAAGVEGTGAAGADPVVLSHGAVWMWNSALAGDDSASGACSLADAPTAACAAAAGITLDQAWDNHAENARLCAEDRLRHQRLIDFLKERQP